MNTACENGDDFSQSGLEKIYARCLEYNSLRHDRILRRFPPQIRKHLESIPFLFHINMNLLPGYINNNVPHTVFGYIPNKETIEHAKQFNSSLNFDFDDPVPKHGIEAIYIQDNLKSGHLILWVIHTPDLDRASAGLLDEKARAISKWLRSNNIPVKHHAVSTNDMPFAYWGRKYNPVHPDKSIFLDEFYSECILLAGKAPAWWMITPDNEQHYDDWISRFPASNVDIYAKTIDFGSIANVRPQDYLAAAIINIINIKQCPEESWLNLLDLCHKLNNYPQIDCVSLRIKRRLHASEVTNIEHPDIASDMMSEAINCVYDTEQTLVITRIVKILAHRHAKNNTQNTIYSSLLARRYARYSGQMSGHNPDIEYITATGLLFNLTRQAFIWLIDRIDSIDDQIISQEGELRKLTQNLIKKLEFSNGHIAITNIHPPEPDETFDIILQQDMTHRNDDWLLSTIDRNGKLNEVRKGINPVELIAWATLNKIVSDKSRISVNSPCLSFKQTQISEISLILRKYLGHTEFHGDSLETFLNPELPVKDIVIAYEKKDRHHPAGNRIHLGLFRQTNYGEVIQDEYDNPHEFITLVCNLLSETSVNRLAYGLFIRNSGSSTGCAELVLDAQNTLKMASQFARDIKKGYTHFVDSFNGKIYVIEYNQGRFIAHHDFTGPRIEDQLEYNNRIKMYFSDRIQDHQILNYLYETSKPGRIQVHYLIKDNTSLIFIIDDNGALIRLTQPFYEKNTFINQWLMFLYNIRKRIRLNSDHLDKIPTIEICELAYDKSNQLIKHHLNSSMLPDDGRYFDLKIKIRGEKGKQSISLICEDKEFTSEQYGRGIYQALRKYLDENISSSGIPAYLTDVDAPVASFDTCSGRAVNLRDYIRYKRNIETRLNALINSK